MAVAGGRRLLPLLAAALLVPVLLASAAGAQQGQGQLRLPGRALPRPLPLPRPWRVPIPGPTPSYQGEIVQGAQGEPQLVRVGDRVVVVTRLSSSQVAPDTAVGVMGPGLAPPASWLRMKYPFVSAKGLGSIRDMQCRAIAGDAGAFACLDADWNGQLVFQRFVLAGNVVTPGGLVVLATSPQLSDAGFVSDPRASSGAGGGSTIASIRYQTLSVANGKGQSVTITLANIDVPHAATGAMPGAVKASWQRTDKLGPPVSPTWVSCHGEWCVDRAWDDYPIAVASRHAGADPALPSATLATVELPMMDALGAQSLAVVPTAQATWVIWHKEGRLFTRRQEADGAIGDIVRTRRQFAPDASRKLDCIEDRQEPVCLVNAAGSLTLLRLGVGDIEPAALPPAQALLPLRLPVSGNPELVRAGGRIMMVVRDADGRIQAGALGGDLSLPTVWTRIGEGKAPNMPPSSPSWPFRDIDCSPVRANPDAFGCAYGVTGYTMFQQVGVGAGKGDLRPMPPGRLDNGGCERCTLLFAPRIAERNGRPVLTSVVGDRSRFNRVAIWQRPAYTWRSELDEVEGFPLFSDAERPLDCDDGVCLFVNFHTYTVRHFYYEAFTVKNPPSDTNFQVPVGDTILFPAIAQVAGAVWIVWLKDARLQARKVAYPKGYTDEPLLESTASFVPSKVQAIGCVGHTDGGAICSWRDGTGGIQLYRLGADTMKAIGP